MLQAVSLATFLTFKIDFNKNTKTETFLRQVSHQVSSETQGSYHICRPLKSTVLTDQFQTVGHSEF